VDPDPEHCWEVLSTHELPPIFKKNILDFRYSIDTDIFQKHSDPDAHPLLVPVTFPIITVRHKFVCDFLVHAFTHQCGQDATLN
jgi:hypothetical protein